MQRSKKIWAIIAVMLAVLTLGAKQAEAQTLDSNNKCHDASGKFAAQSVCGTDAKPKATNTKSSDSKTASTKTDSKSSTKSDSGKIMAEDGSMVNSNFYSKTSNGSSKIKAEDGSMVNADFYSKTDKRPAPTKAISKTDTGNGYLVYAYQPSTGEMYCAVEKTNDEAYYRFHSTIDAGWFIVKGYWASADAKSFKSDCTQ